MRQLFGTDGIRGIAGVAPLDTTTVYAVGLALAHQLRPGALASGTLTPRVIVGRDTRESSPWIANLLAAGLTAGGAEVERARASCQHRRLLTWPTNTAFTLGW